MEQVKALGHDAIQQKVFEHLWNNYPLTRRCIWHTPNELTPDNYVQQEIARLQREDPRKFCPQWIHNILKAWQQRFLIKLSKRKSIGVLAGVTDLVFYWKGVLYMMDIKIGKDKLSEAQLKFIAANSAQGGIFKEIGSVEEGIAYIDSILNP